MATILDIITVGAAQVMTVDVNPVAGIAAPIGSIALALDGSGLYVNTTGSPTAWSQFPVLSVGGSVSISSGGTGATTANGALNNLLPSQTGNATKFLQTDGTNASWVAGNSGTVTTVSVASANGFAGSVANATTTPAITISTTITGLLKGNGTAISAAVAGTDYQSPITLTTTGSSGASTFVGNTLNVPNYTLAGLGGQPLSTNLTSLSGLTYVSTAFVKMTAAGTFSLDTNVYYLASNPAGYTSNLGTVTSVAALTLGTTGTDLSSSVANSTTTPVITLNVPTASATNRGALSSSDWTNFNTAYSNRITSLTTTGSSGAATLSSNTLNIPNYTLAGLGGQPLSTNLTSLAGLTYVSTAFVKMTAAGTFSLDTNTYLTSNQNITLSGEASGSGTTAISVTLSNAAVIGKVLTGYVSGAGVISATDSILSAIQKLNGNIGAIVSGVSSVFGRTGAVVATAGDYTTTLVTEGTNLYYTNARGIGSVLTGYVSGAGVISATDSILSAIQKLNGNIGALVTGVSSVFGRTGAVVATVGDYNTSQVTENTNLYFTNARAIAAPLTGYVSGAGTVTATDSILQAIQKLNGNTAALVTGVSSVNTLTGAVVLTTTNISEGTNLYYTNARGIGSVLTGYVSGAGVVAATDTILQAIQKLNGNIGALVTGVSSVFGRTGAVVAANGDYTTTQVTEGTNLYFTNARAIASTLTGYVSGAGVISSADSILSAIQKLNGNIGALVTGVSSVTGTANQITTSPTTGAVVVSITSNPVIPGLAGMVLPSGATTDRAGSPTPGTIRYNTTTTAIEAFYLGVWNTLASGSFVASVSGTANRITSTGGTAPVIDISAAYVGQTSITTLGTIGTGTWQGTAIADTYISSAATWNAKQNAITFGTGVQTALGVNIGSAGAVVLFNGAGGTPSSITLTNATGLPPTTGIVGWPANASGVLTNNGSGVLSWVPASGTGTVTSVTLSTGTTGLTGGSTITTSGTWTLAGTLVAANGGTGQNTYVIGDLLQANTTTTLARLAAVATGNVLISGGIGVVSSWGKVGLTTHVSGILPIANGGTNISTYTTGDTLYASATNTLSKLAIGTAGQTYTIAAGIPKWVTPATSQSTPANPASTTSATGVMMGLAGSITPAKSGTVIIIITGTSNNNSSQDGCSMQIRTGTGGAPANGAALTGTTRGSAVTSQNALNASGNQAFPFTCSAVVTGLTVGTAVWIDLSLAVIGGAGTATLSNISISTIEI